MSWRELLTMIVEVLSVRTARARLLVFSIVSVIVFIAPIHRLANLSLWGHFGIKSPSIGLTRAYHFTLHGDFTAAWQQNRLIFAVLIIGIPIIAKDVYTVVKQLSIRGNYARRTNKSRTNTNTTTTTSTSNQ